MNSSGRISERAGESRPKTLFLIGAPPGCGKTFYARLLASSVADSVFLDLDVLNPLSEKLCELCGEPFDKGGAFFRRNVRDTEYETLLDIAFAALEFNSTVIVCAPFTKEFRSPELMAGLRSRASIFRARLQPVWILSSPEACRQNMLQRAAVRDKWKLEDLDGYIAGIDLSVPSGISELIVLDARRRGNEQEALESLLSSLRQTGKK